MRRWFDEIEEYSSEGVYKIMVGNKADLESKRAIQYTQAKVSSSEREYKVLLGNKTDQESKRAIQRVTSPGTIV